MRFVRFLISGGRAVEGVALSDGTLQGSDGSSYGSEEVTWLPPAKPTKVVGLVLNYADHAGELGLTTVEDPVLFLKPLNSLIGNFGNIVYPSGAKYMHYEGELAVVIGRQARKVRAENALEFVSGYTIANDVTVRDFITNTFRPPVKAKGFDTFCPLGPCLVTKDEIPDVSNLEIRTSVNGELKQQGNTKDLIHSVPRMIEYITAFMTLESGDVILTGTPKGISPIVAGDRIDIEIDKIGTLSNKVVSEEKK